VDSIGVSVTGSDLSSPIPEMKVSTTWRQLRRRGCPTVARSRRRLSLSVRPPWTYTRCTLK